MWLDCQTEVNNQLFSLHLLTLASASCSVAINLTVSVVTCGMKYWNIVYIVCSSFITVEKKHT